MKSVLILALAVALVAAKPVVNSYEYTYDTAEWITTQINFIVLSILLSIYALIGGFTAFFGDSAWFNTYAFEAISTSWALPSYSEQSFDTMLGDYSN